MSTSEPKSNGASKRRRFAPQRDAAQGTVLSFQAAAARVGNCATPITPTKGGIPTPTTPPPTNLQAPGWAPAEAEVAEANADAQELAAAAPILTQRGSKHRSAATKRKQDLARVDKLLTEDDWLQVLTLFGHTGDVKQLSKDTALKPNHVEHLLNYGVQRLGLPPIRDYAVDQADLHIRLKEKRDKLQTVEAEQAVQERIVQEAAAAQVMLEQAMVQGSVLETFMRTLTQSMVNGQTKLAIPEHLTLGTLEDVTKVFDQHTRAMERAIKLVRLTAGEPTEMIAHQVGVLVAGLSLEDLAEAERTGRLPRSLTARLSGTDPIQNTSPSKVIDATASLIDNGGMATALTRAQEVEDINDLISYDGAPEVTTRIGIDGEEDL
jgi:hypothetical protein